MIDTTTIKYAMSKLESTFNVIAPHAVDLSEKYIKYVVTKEVVSFLLIIIVTIFFMCLTKIFLKLRNEHGYNGYEIGLIFTTIISVIGIISTFISLYYASLALINPEMYVIHQLIKG